MAHPVPITKKIRPASVNRMKSAEYARQDWRLQIDDTSVTVEDMLKPEYWVHVSRMLIPGAVIDAVAADGTWYAEFFVRHIDGSAVHVGLLRKVDFGTPVAQSTKAAA